MTIAWISEGLADCVRRPGEYGMEEWQGRSFDTPYGRLEKVFRTNYGGRSILYFPHSGKSFSLPLNESAAAVFHVLEECGVKHLLSTVFVGGLNGLLHEGDILVPHDFIDSTKQRYPSYYQLRDPRYRLHYRSNAPFCDEFRRTLYCEARQVTGKYLLTPNLFDRGVYLCTEGPRFESAAEIQMYRSYADVVGHSIVPHVYFAREAGIHYGLLCIVSNMAEGTVTSGRIIQDGVLSHQGDLGRIHSELALQTIVAFPASGACKCSDEANWVTRPTLHRWPEECGS